MPANRSNHTTPQLHLRRFAGKHGIQVWRDGRIGVHRSVKNVSVRSDFYTRFDQTGERDDRAERLLAGIEDSAAPVIDKVLQLRELPVRRTPGRAALASFVAHQLTRSARERRSMELFAETYLKFTLQNSTREQVVNTLRGVGHYETKSFAAYAAGDIRLDELEIELDTNHYIDLMEQYAVASTALLVERPWQLWLFPRSWLVTSDDPVCVVPNPEAGEKDALGLKTALMVLMPLSRTAALVIQRPGEPECVCEMDSHAAQIVRRMVVHSAHREIYAHPDDDISFISTDDVGAARPGVLMMEQLAGPPLTIPRVDGLNDLPTRREPRRRRTSGI